VPAPDVRDLLLLTAERLIGEGGTSVSLREIAAEAGQRNNSAVAYHFGSRDGLIEAVVARRLEAMESERLRMIADNEQSGGGDDLRDLVRVLVLPMFTTPYAEGSTHYARFIEKVRDHPAVTGVPLTDDRRPATRIISGRLDRSLGHLPTAVRHRRLNAMATTMFALLADAERRGELGQDSIREEVIDLLVGLLTAPALAATRSLA
jgi:AcrR family transcriptional regulator